ncbi:AAA family ATPase [Oryzibacter oryziterrae]|uniref:AAA family ATPase n=1 Tax=Oryzibacter oryziterrae TaxID=2766474 RepID=UPI001F215F43|nr:ATP-binding protein [Oryzibacter oryziterrae]
MALTLDRSTRSAALPGHRLSKAQRKFHRTQRRAEKRFAPSRNGTLPDALVHAMLRRALRPIAELWADLPMVIALELPEGLASSDVVPELRRIGAGIARSSRKEPIAATEIIEAGATRPSRRRSGTSPLHREILSDMRAHRRVFVTFERDTPIPQDVLHMIDRRITVEAPTAAQLDGLIRHRLRLSLDPSAITALASLRFAELCQVLRNGSDRGQIERRLRRLVASIEGRQKMAVSCPVTLASLPGMGAASEWGQDLARDLADWTAGRLPWRDVDRGLLLHGKPGTGKTTFARALATTCGVPLVVGSFARWQVAGHLGDMLAAMRRTVDEALDKVPSILFIDELDSVGDRTTFSGDSKGYQTEVVNALLECLDGVEGRDGLVVVGACNHPHLIDPAVLRSGRIDRMIEIPLPDAAARLAILRLHLNGNLDDADLSNIIRRTHDLSGADLERLVRGGRRRARKAGQPLQLTDLEAERPPLHKPCSDELRRMAIHEVGHAVVATVLGGRRVEGIWIERDLVIDAPGTGVVTGGGMRVWKDVQALRTEVDHSIELTILPCGPGRRRGDVGHSFRRCSRWSWLGPLPRHDSRRPHRSSARVWRCTNPLGGAK